MNRRDLLRLSLMATLSMQATSSLLAGPTKKSSGKNSAGSAKKGIGLGLKSPNWDQKLKDLNCKWTYSWTSGFPQRPLRNVAYVPMIWGKREDEAAIAMAGKNAKRERCDELLGFNEPDHSDQANMTVQDALAKWPHLVKTRLRLGSPACANPEGEWMTSFMKAAKEQDLRIDFVCVHSYGGDNASAFIERMKKIHQLYEKPIWITEFAVADWNAHITGTNKFKPEDVLRFMEAALPELDKLDFVERYAWFPTLPGSERLGPSALYDETGKLTRLGECYRDA